MPSSARPPADAAALWRAATRATSEGRFAEAEKSLKRLVRLAPDEPGVLGLLGTVRAQMGDHKGALKALDRAVRLDPDNATAHGSLAVCLEAMGKFERARTSYRSAIALDPSLVQARVNYAALLRRNRQLSEAEAQCREAIDANPAFSPARATLAQVMFDAGRIDEVDEVAKKLEAETGDPRVRLLRGRVRRAHGDFDGAQKIFRAVLADDPDNVAACLACFAAGIRDRDDPAVEALLRHAKDADLDDAERAQVEYALAQLHAGEGDARRAMAHWSAGAKLRAVERPWRAADARRRWTAIEEMFRCDDFPAGLQKPVSGPTPVFVVGMPRSGTTLVQQILASHSSVGSAGEQDGILELVRDYPEWSGTGDAYPSAIDTMGHDRLESAATRYLKSLAPFGDEPLMVDKMPANVEHLGLIAMLFPDARIILCRRDPVDTCFSCFTTDFAHGLGWSYDMPALATYYGLYTRMTDHWRSVLPLPIHEVDYENIVADIEAEARALVEFCDLTWEPACLNFHENKRPVTTASSAQVRQPLYSSSVARWKPYQEWLGPLVAGLRKEGIDAA